MSISPLVISIALLFIPLMEMSAYSGDGNQQTVMAEFLTKKDITVLITDSGLGGIAVCADIEHRLLTEHPFRSVKIIFCNALPESDYGYNSMSSTDEKVSVFSDALTGMTKWYSPDIILIACNTLSVLYDQTPYARTAAIPVVSIVDIGVATMTDALKNEPASSVIIYGTETTINAGSHRALLIQNGVAENRIVTQACPDLAGEIQSDASSDAVATMIEFYSDDAAKKLDSGRGILYAALCCTHFGYSGGTFQRALSAAAQRPAVLIDPTRFMSTVIFAGTSQQRYVSTKTSVHVVSRAIISDQETRSIGELVRVQSEPTAQALLRYERKKDLFDFHRKQ